MENKNNENNFIDNASFNFQSKLDEILEIAKEIDNLAQVTQLEGRDGLGDSANGDCSQKSSLHLYHLINSTQPLG